jgi:nicotinamidase-related amidase
MIDAHDSVLIVVDMQNGFVSPESAHIPGLAADFIREWAASGRPYVMTRFVNAPGSLFEKLIGWSKMQDPPSIDIVDELQEFVPGAVAVVDKLTYSLFNDEGAALVAAHGWKNVVVIGLDTESCVLKTAVDAFEADLVPWVITDLVFSHAGQVAHDAGLLVTGRFIGRGQLVRAEEFLAPGTPRAATA